MAKNSTFTVFMEGFKNDLCSVVDLQSLLLIYTGMRGDVTVNRF